MMPLPPHSFIQKTHIFEPISLAEMGAVQLMNRKDKKFLVPIAFLSPLLEDLRTHYRILEIDGNRFSEYKTLYFDTPTLQMYHAHQSGRMNRYKIRQRHYVHTDTVFTEVKFKNNKGRTIKSRIQQNTLPGQLDTEGVADFLTQISPFQTADLQPVLWVNYTRLTFVDLVNGERLTLDLDLSFHTEQFHKHYGKVVVAEIKQDALKNSYFETLMKHYHLREGAMSKYCLGVVSLYPDTKQNRFKRKLSHLHKIIAHHDTAPKPQQP